MEQNKDSLDPLEIPDQRRNFTSGLGPLKFRGVVSLTQLKFHGLPSFRRSGDSHMKNLENGHTEVSIKVAANDLKFEGYAKAQFMGIGPYRKFEGTLKWMDIHMVVTLNEEGKPKLQEFKLNSFDGLTLRLEGGGILNAIFNAMSRTINYIFSTIVRSLIQSTMRGIIQKSMDNPKLLEMIG